MPVREAEGKQERQIEQGIWTGRGTGQNRTDGACFEDLGGDKCGDNRGCKRGELFQE